MSVCILHIKSTPQQFVFSAALPFHVCLSPCTYLVLLHPPAFTLIRNPPFHTVALVLSYREPCPREVRYIPAVWRASLFVCFVNLISVFLSLCPGSKLIILDEDNSSPPTHGHTHTRTHTNAQRHMHWMTLACLYPLTQPATDPLSVEQSTRRTAGFLLQGTTGKLS